MLIPIFNRVFALISYPLTISLSVFAFIFRLLRLPFPRFNTATLRFNFFGATPQGRPRRPPRPGNPADAAERWIRDLEDETGAISVTRAAASASGVDGPSEDALRRRDKSDGRGRLLPAFWIGSYESALKVAQKDAKPMCVILTCEEHDDTAEFKRYAPCRLPLVTTSSLWALQHGPYGSRFCSCPNGQRLHRLGWRCSR